MNIKELEKEFDEMFPELCSDNDFDAYHFDPRDEKENVRDFIFKKVIPELIQSKNKEFEEKIENGRDYIHLKLEQFRKTIMKDINIQNTKVKGIKCSDWDRFGYTDDIIRHLLQELNK